MSGKTLTAPVLFCRGTWCIVVVVLERSTTIVGYAEVMLVGNYLPSALLLTTKVEVTHFFKHAVKIRNIKNCQQLRQTQKQNKTQQTHVFFLFANSSDFVMCLFASAEIQSLEYG